MGLISRTRNLLNLLNSTRNLTILSAILIGIASGLAAVVLKEGIGQVGTWRVSVSHNYPAWLILPAIGGVGGWLSGALVAYFAPETAGSGIPQIKAALAKLPMPLNLKVALIKLCGSILALGSGLALGREGPTVQLAASLANQINCWLPRARNQRRQLIAAGAGAGLAAAFSAPLAGILFVVEELLQDFSHLTLSAAIIASFVGAVTAGVLKARGLDIDLVEASLGEINNISVPEIPFYILIGILAGFLGCLFNRSIIASLDFYRYRLGWSLPWRVAFAGTISGLIMALLPVAFRDHTGLRDLLIRGEAGGSIAALALIAQMLLTPLAYGSGAPGGLFAPTLTMGASLGSLVGIIAQSSLGVDNPIVYAITGMGGFFAAVIRVPVTGIVIIFEMTADFKLVLPLMISSVVAYLVAESLYSGSLYERLLEWQGIHLKRSASSANNILAELTAADCMATEVETLPSDMTVDEVLLAFSDSHHRGFPVVDNNGKLVGIITQTDLSNIALMQKSLQEERKEFVSPGEILLQEIMTIQPVTIKSQATLMEVLFLMNKYGISRVPVVENNHLLGIITRSDIIRTEAEHLTELEFS